LLTYVIQKTKKALQPLRTQYVFPSPAIRSSNGFNLVVTLGNISIIGHADGNTGESNERYIKVLFFSLPVCTL
jgi:hypothetical protein